jgi:hypothetical protein
MKVIHQFYTLGFEGEFDLLDNEMKYDIGSSWGETRVLNTAPIQIAARWGCSSRLWY